MVIISTRIALSTGCRINAIACTPVEQATGGGGGGSGTQQSRLNYWLCN